MGLSWINCSVCTKLFHWLNGDTNEQKCQACMPKGQNKMVPQACVDLAKQFEGCKLAPYKDSVGVATIGFGTTYYDDDTKVTMEDPPITEEKAEALLGFHLEKTYTKVCELVKVECTENQKAALTDFAYNLGLGSLQHSTLLKLLNEGQDLNTVAEEFMKWDKAGGKVLAGLERRRQAEKDLFLS